MTDANKDNPSRDLQIMPEGNLIASPDKHLLKDSESLGCFTQIVREKVTRDELVDILDNLSPQHSNKGVEVIPRPTWIEIKQSSIHGPSFIAVNSKTRLVAYAIPSDMGVIYDEYGVFAPPSKPLLFFGTSTDLPLEDVIKGLKEDDPKEFDQDISQGIARVGTYILNKYRGPHGLSSKGGSSSLTLDHAKKVMIRETLKETP